MITPRSRRWITGLVVAVTLGSGAGLALASVTTPPDLSTVAPVAAQAPAALVSAYPFLRRAATSADTLPPDTGVGRGAGTIPAHFGASSPLARVAGNPGSAAIWLAPGSSGSCLVLPGGGGSCDDNSAIESQGLTAGLAPVDGSSTTLYGVVPSGATVTAIGQDGATRSVALSGQAFVVSGTDTDSVSIHLPNGQVSTQSLGPRYP